MRRPTAAAGRALLLGLAAVLCWAGSPVEAADDASRDFPPVLNPERPPAEVTPVPQVPGTPISPPRGREVSPELEPYLIGVGDELQIAVLDQPTLSTSVKVRPDGAITAPGAGTIFALGRAPEDVSKEIEQKLIHYLRHPRVDLLVANSQERKVYVMGEVFNPGERSYRPGMTVLQAVAQSGGIRTTGKAANVIVLRRTGQDDAVYYQKDLSKSLAGALPGEDLALHPYDIVYVPRTTIGSIGTFVDLYLRPALVPVTLYLYGWDAFNVNNPNTRLTGGR